LADEIETGTLQLIQETPWNNIPEGPSYAPTPSYYRWKMVPDNLRYLQRELKENIKYGIRQRFSLLKRFFQKEKKEFVSRIK